VFTPKTLKPTTDFDAGAIHHCVKAVMVATSVVGKLNQAGSIRRKIIAKMNLLSGMIQLY
jgi:hypothetical protein